MDCNTNNNYYYNKISVKQLKKTMKIIKANKVLISRVNSVINKITNQQVESIAITYSL
jgi:hypothetical protein